MSRLLLCRNLLHAICGRTVKSAEHSRRQFSARVEARPSQGKTRRGRYYLPAALAILPAAGWFSFSDGLQSVEHAAVAAQRCTRIGNAAILSMIDYKRTFAKTFDSDNDRREAYSQCHTRS